MINKQFNGNRLREGRVYRGITITDLANSLNVTKQTISKYENNKSIPSFETIITLTNILDFPIGYFYENPIDVDSGNVYFRSLLTTGKKEREMQYDRSMYLAIIRSFLEEFVDFPEMQWLNNEDIPIENPEMSADYLRKKWNLGTKPINNMIELLETNGFIVTTLHLDNKNIDAFGSKQIIQINQPKHYYSIILSNDKQSFYRRQFDAAHELAHWLLHENQIDIDELSKEEFREIEKEANDFASAFLMPKERFKADVSKHPTDLNYYKHLKKIWCVSINAMIMRAYKLDVINQNQYNYLQRQLSQKKWRKQEPLDNIILLEEPVAMKQAISLLIENSILNPNDFLEQLSNQYNLTLNHTEVETLLSLEKNYLKPTSHNTTNPNNVVNLRDKRTNDII